MGKFNRELYKASKLAERYQGTPNLYFHTMGASKMSEETKKSNENNITMKVRTELNLQLKDEIYKKSAEQCLKVFDALAERNDGSVWASEWFALVSVVKFIGTYPNSRRVFKLNYLGEAFLNSLQS